MSKTQSRTIPIAVKESTILTAPERFTVMADGFAVGPNPLTQRGAECVLRIIERFGGIKRTGKTSHLGSGVVMPKEMQDWFMNRIELWEPEL